MKTKIALTIGLLLMVLLSGQTAAAKVGPPHPGPACVEKLVPFNPTGVANSNPSLYVKEFTETQCKDHAPYPYTHNPISQTDAETLYVLPQKAADDNEITHLATHHHFYHNTSEEDANYIYKSLIAEFEITLENDAITNTYTDVATLVCPTFANQPGDINDPNSIKGKFSRCVNGAKDPNLFGGTTIKRDVSSNEVKITWSFGVDDPYKRPQRVGLNPSVDLGNNPQIFTCDTNNINAECRTFEMYVWMIPKDFTNIKQLWTATTTSKILILDLGLPKSKLSQANNGSAWEVFSPANYNPVPQVKQVYNAITDKYATYYYVNIGTVSTIWKPVKTPPPSSYCTGLELSGPGELKKIGDGSYEYVPEKGASFNVLPSFSNDPVPLDYRWNAKEFTINWGDMGIGSTPESSKVQLPGGNTPVQANLSRMLFAAVASPSSSMSSQITQSATGITGNLVPYIVNYGKFFDSITQFQTNPSSGKNPFVDGGNIIGDDRSSYYTGGPEGTLIIVQGVDPAAPDVYAPEAYVGNNCQALIIIPKEVEENTCIDLEISPNKAEPLTPVPFTVTPKFKDQTKPFPLDYYWTSSNQAPSAPSAPGNLQIVGDSVDNMQPMEITPETSKIDPDLLPQNTQTNLLAQIPMKASNMVPITSPSLQADFNKVPLPGIGGLLPKVYGLFEDFLGAGDLANPYWEIKDNKTHFTGGTAGTWISVQAYGKDKTLYPFCKASLQIPPDEEGGDKCLDARIVRGPNAVDVGDQVQLEDPIDGLWVQVATDPQEYEADLNFDWEVTGTGELYATDSNFGTRVTTTNYADPVNLNGAADGTRVTVQAVDPENKLENIAICNDSFVVKDSGEENICLNLNLSNTNPNLKTDSSTRLKASPVREDGTPITIVRWSENGAGGYVLGPSSVLLNMSVPGYCPQPPAVANQSFTAPAECEYIYYAGPNGGDSFRVEAVPHDGVIDCMYQYTVPKTPPPRKPYCVNLDLTPNSINRGTRTNYIGKAYFSNGITYNVDVAWSGQNGTFSNNSTFELRKNVPSSGFANYFNHSPANSSGRVEAAVTRAYGDVSQDFGFCSESIQIPEREDKDECTYLYLRWPYDGLVCIGTDHEGNFIWGKNGTEGQPSNELCIEATKDDEISVEAIGYEEVCSDEYIPDETPPEYKLEKWVSIKSKDDNWTNKTVTIPQDRTEVWYKLVFTPEGETTAVITDTISGDGFIIAEILPVDAEGKPVPGVIKYDETYKVFEDGFGELESCSDSDLEEDEEPEHCYNGDLGDSDGIELVKVSGAVSIQYSATVESALNPEYNGGKDICKDGIVCEEKYRNRSSAHITFPEDLRIRSNDIEIQIFCQYILTQAAGDIFLERDLSYGIDIQQCSEISSSPGIVITPGLPKPTELGSTGQGDTEIFTVSHELCTAGLAGDLPAELLNIYGQDVVPRLSGQICEVRLPTGEAWKQTFITNSIDENKTRLSRWGADVNNDQKIISFQEQRIQDNSVYHIQGGDLTMATIDTLNDGQGAKTFIIEDGDLIIEKNITYGNCPDANCTVRDTASLAFIVLNGSVYIDPTVTEIAGVFFVQEGDKSADGYRQRSGRFFSGTQADFEMDSFDTLKVTGSLYGDIDPLFGNRRYAGDPISGEGGVVIRFDQRIILNTPPGLRDVLNLTQTEVAR